MTIGYNSKRNENPPWKIIVLFTSILLFISNILNPILCYLYIILKVTKTSDLVDF